MDEVTISSLTHRKVLLPDSNLGRPAFFEEIRVGDDPPDWQLLFFGGSGITADEYEQRRLKTTNHAMDPVLERMQHRIVVKFVTAPFDLPYARMVEDDDDAFRWLIHVDEEVLGHDPMPSFIASYSGGARLAFTGVQQLSSVFGCAALAADGLYPQMDFGAFQEKPTFFYNRNDPVLRFNEATARRLGNVVVNGSGSHDFPDYLDQFEDLLDLASARFAAQY